MEGFKSISSLRLDLRPLNILIGGNGSGKSNFLSLFRMPNLPATTILAVRHRQAPGQPPARSIGRWWSATRILLTLYSPFAAGWHQAQSGTGRLAAGADPPPV